MNNELYHYGVKGMKWGVRRSTEYRADVAKRKRLSTAAGINSRFAKAYGDAEKKDTRQVNRMIRRDMAKTGELTDKTKKRVALNKELKKDLSAVRSYNQQSWDALQKHVDGMVERYGDKYVKNVKHHTKYGQQYVKACPIADLSIIKVRRKTRIDLDGNEAEQFVPINVRYRFA